MVKKGDVIMFKHIRQRFRTNRIKKQQECTIGKFMRTLEESMFYEFKNNRHYYCGIRIIIFNEIKNNQGVLRLVLDNTVSNDIIVTEESVDFLSESLFEFLKLDKIIRSDEETYRSKISRAIYRLMELKTIWVRCEEFVLINPATEIFDGVMAFRSVSTGETVVLHYPHENIKWYETTIEKKVYGK